jgi:hypothetical protein
MHIAPDLTQWFWTALGLAPMLFWLLIGAMLCFVNARTQPKRATMIGIALAIMVAHSVLTVMLFGTIIDWMQQWLGDVQTAIAVAQVAAGVPHTFAMLLILWAAFHGDSRVPADVDAE